MLDKNGKNVGIGSSMKYGRPADDVWGTGCIDVHHVGNKLKLFTRNALGSIYDSGSIVTAATYSLNVTDGSYYFSSDHYLPSGGTGITFSQYVRNGATWSITNTNVVTSQYDNNTGSLVGMSASYFTKHTLYVSGDGVNQKYLLVIGQTQYDNIINVEGAALPTPPIYFLDSITPIASIVVRQGTSTIYNVLDIRPVIGFKSTGVNASSTHRFNSLRSSSALVMATAYLVIGLVIVTISICWNPA
jgi:hypothetical protein